MISFVWPPGERVLAGTGGSETYTAGHVRELLRRNIETQIVTIGMGTDDGRQDFPDIPFLALDSEAEANRLPGTVVFVNYDYLPARKKDALILHNAIIPEINTSPEYTDEEVKGRVVIATSIYSGQQWALKFNIPSRRIKIVMPFADPIFGEVTRPPAPSKIRILFAGRLRNHKGIYTLLEALHDLHRRSDALEVTIVAAGLHEEPGETIARMLRGYPYANIIPARKSVKSMAQLLAANDILLMPSVYAEPFGMLSVEAQHAGCRVVASNVGGLPETNCGLLTLIKPHSPDALITGIDKAIALGPVTDEERELAKNHFTLSDSVGSLLRILNS